MVNDFIIVELKAAEILVEEHELQLINYLRATEKEVGLLLNFGKSHNSKENYLQMIKRQSHQCDPVESVSSVFYYSFAIIRLKIVKE